MESWIDWLIQDKPWEWILSGIGVPVILGILGWLWVRRKEPPCHSGSGKRQSPKRLALASSGAAGAAPRIDLTDVSAGRDIAVQLGYTPEQLRSVMTDQRELTELKVKLGVTEQALRTFFVILEQAVPSEQWPARLPEIALRHKQALERLAALDPEDPRARALTERASAAVDTGDYGEAERLLDQAEQLELAGIQSAKRLLREAQAALDRKQLSAAAVRAEKAELFLIQLRYREAAEQFAAAVALVPESEPKRRLTYLGRRARALCIVRVMRKETTPPLRRLYGFMRIWRHNGRASAYPLIGP